MRSSCSASALRSMPDLRAGRSRPRVKPSNRSWTSSRRVQQRRDGPSRHADSRAATRAASPSPPSRRLRGGSRAPRAGSPRTGASSSPERTPWPNVVRRCATFGEQRERGEVALDDFLRCRAAGPSRRRLRRYAIAPRYVCPIDAAASGSQSNSANTFSISVPSSASSTGRTSSTGCRRDPVLQRRELAAHLGREEVDAGRCDLPELDVDAAGLLEDAPERAHPLRRAHASARRPLERNGPNPSRRARRSNSRYRRSTAIRRLNARGSGGARTTSPACSPDRERAGPRQQVERDGDGHRRGDADRERVQDEVLSAPVPIREVQRKKDAAIPNRRCRRRAPCPSRAGCRAAAATRRSRAPRR